ncbi:MAG: MFS transporter [Lysobacterales bacterium]
MIRAITSVATLLFGTAILLTGQGLQGTLLPVRATLENFSTISIGVMGATYFLGFTYGCWKGSVLIRGVGHVRVFAAMTAVASATPLLHGLWVNPWIWSSLRFVSGFCFAVLYLVIESWLNERSTNRNRASVFSAYILINMTVLGIGQQMLLFYDPLKLNLFALTSVLVSLAAVPVALSKSENPRPIEDAKLNFRYLYRNSTVGMLGSLGCGLANGSFWALAPVFSVSYSGDISLTANFMTAVVFGGAIGQWPLGWLSDRMDRRIVLGAISFAGVIIGAIMWSMATELSSIGLILLAALWGAVAFPIYSISVAHANDRAETGSFVMVSAGLLLMYGIGAIIGPFLASAMMTFGGSDYLFLFTGIVHLLLALYVVTRRFVRPQTGMSEHRPFSEALASTQTRSQIYEDELERGD